MCRKTLKTPGAGLKGVNIVPGRHLVECLSRSMTIVYKPGF